ncbi:MAG: hypothetical protein ACYS22_11485 [Planctomycetota bacterium]|jgi:cbb3-type cytochrome oxidase subunit 3
MLRDALTHLDLRDAPIASLILFFSMFLFVCLFTALRNGEKGQAASLMPLDDGAVPKSSTAQTPGA